MAMANGQRALASSRAVGFFWARRVARAVGRGVRGHTYGRPVATMRAYLEAMGAAPYGAPEPAESR